MSWVRDGHYRLLARLSDVEPVRNSTGFGLCDRAVIEIIREMNEPYPYFRGLLPEIGFPIARIEYTKPLRKRGKTKNNFYTLFDLAMLGITTHSKVPLRLATIGGFALSALSLVVALAYLIAKLLFWYRFSAGIAPILIGLFVTVSVQFFFLWPWESTCLRSTRRCCADHWSSSASASTSTSRCCRPYRRLWRVRPSRPRRGHMEEVKIGSHAVGDGHPCYVIAEIGINHNGDLDTRQAADQRRRRRRLQRGEVPEAHRRRRLHARGAGQAAREPVRRDQRRPEARAGVRRGGVRGDRPLLQGRASIPWFASCWDEASVDFIDQFDPACYKIASASLTDDDLLRHTRSQGQADHPLDGHEHARADRPRRRGAGQRATWSCCTRLQHLPVAATPS